MELTNALASAIDPGTLAHLPLAPDPDCDDREDDAAHMARRLLAEAPRRLSTLGAAIAAQDTEAIVEEARRLGRAALDAGAVRLSASCLAVEQSAGIGSLHERTAQWCALAREFDEVRATLTK